MKRLIIVLFLAALLLGSVPGILGLAQPIGTPHEDPAAAKETQNPILLLVFYGDIFNLTSQSRYQDARELLDAARFASIPDSIKYIIDRYNELSQQLVSALDDLEKLLDEAEHLLNNYQMEQAVQNLEEAESLSGDAGSLLAEIEAATENLAGELGVFLTEADARLIQAYDRLEEVLDRLHQLISRLNQINKSLSDRYISQSQVDLSDTELTLIASPISLFIGQQLTATGRLTSDGNSLADRVVVINLDDNAFSVITDEDGSFKTDIVIPYRYVSNMTLRAGYHPTGNDIGVFTASQSLPVIINTRFYTTILEASAPDSSRPGLPVVIEGQVYSSASTPERDALIFLDNKLIYNQKLSGPFSIRFPIPDDIADGDHTISIVVAPEERFSGARRDLSISISRLPITLDIQMPAIILLPNSIELSGRTYYLGQPITVAQVDLTFNQKQVTVFTDNQGYFSANIETSLDLSLMGPQQILFYVTPVEPYYASLVLEKWLFTINTANIGFMLAIFISLGFITYTRFRTRPAKKSPIAVSPEAEKPEAETKKPLSIHMRSLSAARSIIYTTYLKGLKAVEEATKITMPPNATLREFSNKVKPLLNKASLPFERLTRIAEIALYAAVEPGADLTTEASELSATIIKEASRGNA